jgi:chromosome segregation ATPase
MQLDHWAQMANKHWREFLPAYYQSLTEQGILSQELQKAGEGARGAIADLMESGLRYNEALEIALPQYILLPPEKDQAPVESN